MTAGPGNNSLHRGQQSNKDHSGFILLLLFELKLELNFRTTRTVKAFKLIFEPIFCFFTQSGPVSMEMLGCAQGMTPVIQRVTFKRSSLSDVIIQVVHLIEIELSCFQLRFDTEVCCMFQTAEETNVL